MVHKSKVKETELYEIAVGQLGFFTAQQAVKAGFWEGEELLENSLGSVRGRLEKCQKN